MKILIIEDEPKTAAFIRRGFVEECFAADLATDGPDGLHLVLTGIYDLIVLDVTPPKQDGWSVLTQIREVCPVSL